MDAARGDGGGEQRRGGQEQAPGTEPGECPRLWDTHTHLQDASFDADLAAVVARAGASGVERMVLVGVDERDFTRIPATLSKVPGSLAALGIHPLRLRGEDARADPLGVADRLATALGDAARRARPAAIGEIGLDGQAGPDDAQVRLFRPQLALARELDVAVLFHCRRRFGELVGIVKRDGLPRRGGIYHAFTGSREMAEELVGLGIRLGIGGPLTYGNAERLRALAATLPLDSLVLETDCPDLPPESHRGERNEPAYIREVFATLCGVRAEAPAAVAGQLERNCRALLEAEHA